MPFPHFLLASEMRVQNLYYNRRVEADVESVVHARHPALANRLDQPIAIVQDGVCRKHER